MKAPPCELLHSFRGFFVTGQPMLGTCGMSQLPAAKAAALQGCVRVVSLHDSTPGDEGTPFPT